MDINLITLDTLTPNDQALLMALHLPEDCDDSEEALAMLHEACTIAKPCAIYAAAEVVHTHDAVAIGGVEFRWPLVKKNTENAKTVYPYIASCGPEAEQWSKQFGDPLSQFIADAVKLQLLGQVQRMLFTEVRERFFPEGKMAAMNPGSLKEWPISEQISLFRLFGGAQAVRDACGVYLTDSFLMLPSKSVSGFFFYSEKHYENCALCPMIGCPNRRAPYEASTENML